MSRRHVIPRRTLLRGLLAGGAAVALPLPRLGGMLNGNGTAYADDSPLRPRFLTWFFGNGIDHPLWVPPATGSGDAWALSPSLQPLAEYKPWLTVLSGYDIKVPNTRPHATHPVAMLTGADALEQGFVKLPTIDQRIAQVINKDTAYPGGLHVGISSADGATSMGIQISFNGPSAPNPPNYSPAALFANLVGLGGSQEPDPALFRRQKILDAVADDIRDLKTRLGKEDRVRLDRHLDGVAELQVQIDAALMGHDCGLPIDPDAAYPDRGDDGYLGLRRCEAFSDLLAFALACELTRVATFMFSCAACHAVYSEIDLGGSFHEDYGHLGSLNGFEYAKAGYQAGIAFAMNGLATLLKRLRDTPDGDGSLLDNSVVLATSCVGEPTAHLGDDYPILLLGKGGGRLKGDLHHRGQAENASKVPFTLLKMFGGQDASFGQDEGFTTETIPELFAG